MSTGGVTPEGAQAKERRLESWGEIAAYLRREIRTVQRWESKYGLPVHRLQLGKNSSVYAFLSELDKWYREREREVKADDPSDEPEPAPIEGPNPVLVPVVPAIVAVRDIEVKPPRTAPFYKRKSSWYVAAVLLFVFGLFLIGGVYWYPALTPRNPSLSPAGGKMRLFVRPLQNIAADPEQTDFTEGLTNELNTRLGKLDPKRLGVIAPTSSKQLGAKSITDLQSLLKIDYLLEGSVRRENQQVRINVSLISAREQTHLWSDSYTENLSDILKVQDQVAEAVAQKLLLNLPAAGGASSAASVDPEGYSSYLRGRRFWSVRDLSRSVPAFEDAVKKMPQYVPAHAALAASYLLMGQAPNDAVPPSISAPKAKTQADLALAMGPANAEAHYVLGNLAMSFYSDFPSAERELRQAIAEEPNNATAHQWFGQYLVTQNRLQEAEAETLKALELDPVSPIFTATRAEVSYYARDYDATIDQAKLTLEQFPNFLLGEFWLASAYRQKKMYPEALQHFRTACSLAPGNPALLMALGHALAVSGDRQGAFGILAQLQALSHKRYVPSSYIAGIYIGLGDANNAFLYLNRAVTEHNDRLMYLAVEPIADPLRSDPRFQAILSHMHLDHLGR